MISKTEIIRLDTFDIVGITVRTTNQNAQALTDIGNLWTRFMQEGVLSNIPDKVNDDVYCVYTEYEGDHTAPYTALLGCKVSSQENLPEGYARITIAAETYKIYFLEGKFPDNVGEAWMEIWENAVNRRYTADFDLYSAGAKSFEETEVKIYLAVE